MPDPNYAGDRETTVWTALRECNWLQALEGDIDTGHLAILHLGGIKPEEMEPGTFALGLGAPTSSVCRSPPSGIKVATM